MPVSWLCSSVIRRSITLYNKVFYYEIDCELFVLLLGHSSMSATSGIENIMCQLCSQLYTDPLMLPCLHSFCKSCINKLVNTQDTITCPTCSEVNSIPQDGVSAFPHNACLAQQVEQHKFEEKPSSAQCEGCVASVAAAVYCNQCCEFLCDTCKDYHKISRKTKDHELVDAEVSGKHLPSNSTNAHKPLYCSVPQHSDEKLKFYCEDCKILVCSFCILRGNHKNHSYCDCDKVVEACHSDLHASVQGCTEIVTTLGDAISNGERMIQQIQGRQQEVNQEINSTFDALQVALADRRKALLKESHNITIGKVTAINIQLETYRKLKDQVSFASKYVTDILQSQQSTELSSIKKTIKERLKKLKGDFESISCDLMEDDTIITSLDHTEFEREISRFGAVDDIDVCPSLCEIKCDTDAPLVVKEQRIFTVSLKDRSGGQVKGRVPIKADLVKCCDSTSTREEIVNLNVSKENDQYTLTCTPDTVGEYELSVKVKGTQVKNSPYVIWVKVKQRDLCNLPRQQVFNSGAARGVAVHSNGDVFTSCSDGYIRVYGKNGEEKKKIGAPGNGNGQFKNPNNIVLVGDIIYVVDQGNNRVQKFTIAGEYIGQFGSKGSGEGQLSAPEGIAYNGKNQVIITDSGNRVQVFDLDGTFVKAINCDDEIYGVAADSNSSIHVPLYSCGVQVFSKDGTKLNRYATNIKSIENVAEDEIGYKYILASNRLYILSLAGIQINVIDGFPGARQMAFDTERYIYVAASFGVTKL